MCGPGDGGPSRFPLGCHRVSVKLDGRRHERAAGRPAGVEGGRRNGRWHVMGPTTVAGAEAAGRCEAVSFLAVGEVGGAQRCGQRQGRTVVVDSSSWRDGSCVGEPFPRTALVLVLLGLAARSILRAV
jgi:hypothetical protein